MAGEWRWVNEGEPGIYLIERDRREVAMVSIVDTPHPAVLMEAIVDAFRVHHERQVAA